MDIADILLLSSIAPVDMLLRWIISHKLFIFSIDFIDLDFIALIHLTMMAVCLSTRPRPETPKMKKILITTKAESYLEDTPFTETNSTDHIRTHRQSQLRTLRLYRPDTVYIV